MVFTAGRGRARLLQMGRSLLAANAKLDGRSIILKITISDICPVSFPAVRSSSSSVFAGDSYII